MTADVASPGNNLWEQLLRETGAAAKARVRPGFVLLFGDDTCAKNALLEKFCQGERGETGYEVSELLSYNYFAACDPDEKDSEAESSRVGVWSIGPRAVAAGVDLETILTPQSQVQRKVLIVIALDSSVKPEAILESFKYWLGVVRTFLISLFGKQGGKVDPKAKLSSITSELDIPLITLMVNAESIHSADLSAMKAYKNLQGSLRSLCLEFNSALIYVSAPADLNCAKFQRYMLKCLYDDKLQLSLDVSLEDGIGTAVIPRGLDSPELIALATGINTADVLAHYNGDFLSTPIQSSDGDIVDGEASTAVDPSVTIENEQDWLGRLKKFIALAEATSSSSSTTADSGMGGSSKIERSASGSGLAASASAALSTSGAETENTSQTKPASTQSRRIRTTATTNTTGGQDPTDFFKNLLGDKPAKS